jgi:hypothetical protein
MASKNGRRLRAAPNRGQFKTGQRGNPGGRPRVLKDIQELAREKSPEAIEMLAKIMQSGKVEAARVAAARELLDRGYGRPMQSVSQTMKIEKRAEDMTDDELATIAASGGSRVEAPRTVPYATRLGPELRDGFDA